MTAILIQDNTVFANMFGLSMEQGEIFVNSLHLAEVLGVEHKEVLRVARRKVELFTSLIDKGDAGITPPILREELYIDSMNREQKVFLVPEGLAYHIVFFFQSEEAVRIQAVLVEAICAFRKLYIAKLSNDSDNYKNQVTAFYSGKTEYQKRYMAKALESDSHIIFRRYETLLRVSRNVKTPRDHAASENPALSVLGCKDMARAYTTAAYAVYELLLLKEEGVSVEVWPTVLPERKRASVEKLVSAKEFERFVKTACEWDEEVRRLVNAQPTDRRGYMIKHLAAQKAKRDRLLVDRKAVQQLCELPTKELEASPVLRTGLTQAQVKG